MKNKNVKTDDFVFMQSELELEVYKPLNIVTLTHKRQNGEEHVINIHSGQLKEIANYLLNANKWIESGYKNNII